MTGGGTSGHVLPALAVAEALVRTGHDPASILYVGCTRGIETRLLPDTDFPHVFYDVVGLQRSLSRRNIGFLPKLVRATRRAIAAFRADRPRVVVSVGGYASLPAVLAAFRLRIPVVVVSYDRTPGLASRLAARRAAACAVSFENSPLPRAELTGAPIRQQIFDVDRIGGRADARRRLGLPSDRFVVAVMGGSQGSGVLNRAIAHYVADHRDDTGLAVRQVAGERFADAIESLDRGDDGVIHQVIGYEGDMPAVYAAADLLVGRGGASTVHEVAVTGTPAILVPWADSAEDHQTDNVRWLTERDAAVLLPESRLDELDGEIERLRHDPAARESLADAARRRGDVHRSGALARLIERVAVSSVPS
ncbi:MAG: UDP-N-acetylglucosamine--N-acetylmuramyl-(pentapeptide) pyrophosphoryl-undecaprenol N-acetylglucosamine transferase [Ilumatobacter sp.]|nr:UDP-N-acetylglucosamine--N-acetylmuramyl-(pentapeptide) pyrophosphoryl-undecaprenol N-acetylglucosamine transferase [Ilumatobacter sp.]